MRQERVTGTVILGVAGRNARNIAGKPGFFRGNWAGNAKSCVGIPDCLAGATPIRAQICAYSETQSFQKLYFQIGAILPENLLTLSCIHVPDSETVSRVSGRIGETAPVLRKNCIQFVKSPNRDTIPAAFCGPETRHQPHPARHKPTLFVGENERVVTSDLT